MAKRFQIEAVATAIPDALGIAASVARNVLFTVHPLWLQSKLSALLDDLINTVSAVENFRRFLDGEAIVDRRLEVLDFRVGPFVRDHHKSSRKPLKDIIGPPRLSHQDFA